MRFPMFISLLGLLPALVSAEDQLVWLTTDFTSGGLVMQQAGECVTEELNVQVAGDAVVRSQDGYIFILNRFGYDNVTVLSASDPENVIIQFSTGNGSNPQDILIVGSNKAYITLLEESELLVVDFLTGEWLGRIDLSCFADTSDGLPEMSHLIPNGDNVLVVCQRLDRTTPNWDPSGPGCLAVIDPTTETIVDMNPGTPDPDPIWLPLSNPTSWAPLGSSLLLTCTGSWLAYDDGALVRIDPAGQEESEIIVTEAEAGGNLSEVAACGNVLYLVRAEGADADWANTVLPYYLSDELLGPALSATSDGFIPDLVTHQGILYIADRGTWSNPELAGLLLVDCSTDSLICGPVSTGLPPSNGALVSLLDTNDLPVADGHITLVRFSPNPAQSAISLSMQEKPGLHVSAELVDIAGRVLSKRTVVRDGAVLSLRDRTGRSLSSGSYVLRIRGDGFTENHLLVVRK